MSHNLLLGQTTIINKSDELILLGQNVSFLEDTTGQMSIEELQKNEKLFQKASQSVFARPATQNPIWFKFTIENHTSEDAWIEVGTTYAWHIDFYAKNTLGNIELVCQTGAMHPDKTKQYPSNVYWFPVNKSGQTEAKTYYLRVKAGLPFELPLQLGTIRSLSSNKDINDYLTAGFIGLILIILLYNLFLLISTKDQIYAYYIAYLAFMGISMPYANGYPFISQLSIGFIDNIWWNKYFLVWHTPVYIFVGLFCIKYLHLGKDKGNISFRLIQGELIIACVFPVLLLIGIPLAKVVTAFQVVVMLLYFTCLFTSYYFAFKKDKQARFYALGWTFYIAFVFVFFSVINGFIAFNPFTRNALYFGVGLEVWMFSLALGDRMNLARKAKEKAQKELLFQTQENEKLVREQNTILEKKVSERTKELHDKNEEVQQQNEEINQQNEELTVIQERLIDQNDTLSKQKHVIEMTHKKITASINYAERIQKAILPQPDRISSMLPDSFIFFRPRDVVSGDFYWTSFVRDNQGNKKVVFATGDCTGHGVPGAFMSMAGANLLAQIVNDRKISDPGFVLDLLHAGIKDLLQQDENENRDGMDISISTVDWNAKTLEYGGAKRPLYYVQNNEMNQIKGDIYPVGGFMRGVDRRFTTKKVSFAESPMMAYTFSDGYPDQIGGPEVRKFMTKRFRKMLFKISGKSTRAQKQHLGITLDKWQGNHKQLDDILVVGMRLE